MATGEASDTLANAVESKSFPVKIFFLDNSYKTLMVPEVATCETVCYMVAEKLNFTNPEEDAGWFSLYESKDGASLSRCLAADSSLFDVHQGLKEFKESKIVFQLKIFLECFITSPDPAAQYMRYIQAVYCINTSTYPITKEEAVKYALFQFIFKFGHEKLSEYTLDDMATFLSTREIEFFPLKYHDPMNAQLMMSKYEELKTAETCPETKEAAMMAYLEGVTAMKCYGCTFYPCQQFVFKEDHDIQLGVHAKGFMLFTQGSSEYFHVYELSDCLRWGYVPTSSFYISIKSNNAKNVIFGTVHGPEICDAMTAYAFGWLKHARILKERFNKAQLASTEESLSKVEISEEAEEAEAPVETEEIALAL